MKNLFNKFIFCGFLILLPNFVLNKYIPKIKVYTESLCPDCINFEKNSFKEFYEKVTKPNLVDIEFIPFGNAKEVYNETTKKWDFECQHGENECYGNLIETCAIQSAGKIKSLPLLMCIGENIALNQKNFDITLEYCLKDDEVYLNEIKDCITSDIGNIYQHQMAQKTGYHKWVPWIEVDGVYDEQVELEIFNSLIDFLCKDDYSKCY